MSRQAAICHAVAAALKETFGGMPGVTVAVEDACNPSEAIEKTLGSFGVLVMVAASGHRRRPGAGASTDGDLSIALAVIENPKRNRKSGVPGPTVTSVAETAKDALHWREVEGRRIVYVEMQRADAADDDYRMAVEFLALPCSGHAGRAPLPGPIEPEEIIEARLTELIAAAMPGWDVIGALAAAPEGRMKELPDTRVTVAVDVASQDLDWTGPGIPRTYTARVAVRCSNADDVTGGMFRDACRTVRDALRGLLGDGCAAMDAGGFSCDAFMLSGTETAQDLSADSGGSTKTYNATVTGRFNPQQETDDV